MIQSTFPTGISLGTSRDAANLAFLNQDHFKARAEAERAARSLAYPSPPMSGSSPLPPNPHRDAIYREQRPFEAPRQDVYGGDPGAQGRPHSHGHSSAPLSHLPPMQIASHTVAFHDRDRRPSPYTQSEDSSMHSRPYSPQIYHNKLDARYSGPSPTSSSSLINTEFSSMANQQDGHDDGDGAARTSPKSQRKTKGHVASACVPCKRAHLRYVQYFKL